MTLKPYPEYKESGVEWLGTPVPAHWSAVKLGHLARLQSGSAIDGELVHESGRFPVYGGGGFRGYTDTFTNRRSHVLVGRQGALCGNVRLAVGPFFATEHALVAYERVELDTRWLAYNLEVMNLGQYSQSAAQPGLSADVLQAKRTTAPPIGEQRAIAAFLDHETAEIDAFIADQEELIALLTERRAATISHAVTKGLEPSVPVKDSGVEWLPVIPASWSMRPLWSVFDRIKDVGHPGEQMLSVFREHGVVIKDDFENINKTAENRNIYQLVHEGWLVANRMKAWQGSVGISSYSGIVSGHYICLRPRHRESSRFLNMLFRSRAYTDGYRTLSRGVRIGQAEIDNDLYRLMPVLLPPREEQDAIVAYLDHETSEIDAAVADAREAIALSKERRAALISAAVTGKIDVRDHGGVE